VAEFKEKDLNPYLEFDSKNNGRRQIINTDPTATILTATIQLEILPQ
jgi:hypothetical protein